MLTGHVPFRALVTEFHFQLAKNRYILTKMEALVTQICSAEAPRASGSPSLTVGLRGGCFTATGRREDGSMTAALPSP